MRCLVTGAAGFIGSRLSVRLIAEGHDVIGFDDLSTGSLDNLSDAPEVDLQIGDLRDEASVWDVARDRDVIFHLGAVRSVPRSMEEPGSTTDVNVRGTANVLIAAARSGSLVVSASSSSVYGEQDRYPLVETMTPDPRSPYAVSKLAGEAFCRTWGHAFGVRTVSLRYFNVYGPRQDPSSQYAVVVPIFALACLTGDRPVIHGDGEQARDFTYIDDAIEATVRAAHADGRAWGRVFNVGGGRTPTSVNELLRKIAALTGSEVYPLHGPPREGDVRLTHADLAAVERVVGYHPKWSIDDGLAQVVEWFKTSFQSSASS